MSIKSELDKCINCGICNEACPIYRLVGLEHHSPRGYLNLIREFALGSLENGGWKWIFESFLCEKCLKACPLEVDIPGIISAVRKSLVERQGKHSFLERVKRNFKASGNPYTSRVRRSKEKSGKNILFKGCVNQAFLREEIKTVKAILRRFNYDFGELGSEVCCGYPLEKLGLSKMAEDAYKHNAELFRSLGVREVLTLCPTCKEILGKQSSKPADFTVLSIIDYLSEIFRESLPIIRGLDIKFAYIHSKSEDDEKALEIIQKIPKVKVSDIIEGFSCHEVNSVNYLYAESILRKSAEKSMNRDTFIFISTSPVNVYILRKALKNKPVVVESTTKLISLSLGISF